MPHHIVDVVVVGAGAAGLAATQDLCRRGLKVTLLEARDRIGGRVFTVKDVSTGAPVELGAEFLHGKPEVLLETMREAGLTFHETGGDRLTRTASGLRKGDETGKAWKKVSKGLKANGNPDLTFDAFLKKSDHPQNTRELAAHYVEGFHAAHRDRVSVQSLAIETEASERIQGEKLFRIDKGYGALMQWYADQCEVSIRLNSWVRAIRWVKQRVRVEFSAKSASPPETVTARAVLITVPLPLIQDQEAAAAIRFDPEIPAIRTAARRLTTGQAVRTTLSFYEPIWNTVTGNIGMVSSPESALPAWWTALPDGGHRITGWAGGPRAEQLPALPELLQALALRSLSQVLGTPESRLKQVFRSQYFHDWSRDPFSLGAYSYTPVYRFGTRMELTMPVQDTLFFAGEATSTTGEHGTVHGAVGSGLRAGRQIAERLSS
jgi:monoamine oxidase